MEKTALLESGQTPMSLTLIHKFTLAELQRKFTAGDVTATEIVRAYFLRVMQVEPKVKAYVTQCKDAALAQAEASINR